MQTTKILINIFWSTKYFWEINSFASHNGRSLLWNPRKISIILLIVNQSQVMEQLQVLENAGEDGADDADKKNNIVFNATSEFCRTLGDIPTYGLSGNREDQEDLMVTL